MVSPDPITCVRILRVRLDEPSPPQSVGWCSCFTRSGCRLHRKTSDACAPASEERAGLRAKNSTTRVRIATALFHTYCYRGWKVERNEARLTVDHRYRRTLVLQIDLDTCIPGYARIVVIGSFRYCSRRGQYFVTISTSDLMIVSWIALDIPSLLVCTCSHACLGMLLLYVRAGRKPLAPEAPNFSFHFHCVLVWDNMMDLL